MSRSKHPHGITCLAQDPLGMLESHVYICAKRWFFIGELSFAAMLCMHEPYAHSVMS
jgi:hypothetical protein